MCLNGSKRIPWKHIINILQTPPHFYDAQTSNMLSYWDGPDDAMIFVDFNVVISS